MSCKCYLKDEQKKRSFFKKLLFRHFKFSSKRLQIDIRTDCDIGFFSPNIRPDPLNIGVEINIAGNRKAYTQALRGIIMDERSLCSWCIKIAETAVNGTQRSEVIQLIFGIWIERKIIEWSAIDSRCR